MPPYELIHDLVWRYVPEYYLNPGELMLILVAIGWARFEYRTWKRHR